MFQIIKRITLGVVTTVIAPSIVLSMPVKPAQADYLVQKAKVVRVENTSGNGDNFAILVTGGTGACNNTFIIFPASAVTNRDIYEHGYQSALTAVTNPNLTVDVFDYSGASCYNGGQIVLNR
ncbi:MAG: DUF5992 family protein [Nostoc sp.]